METSLKLFQDFFKLHSEQLLPNCELNLSFWVSIFLERRYPVIESSKLRHRMSFTISRECQWIQTFPDWPCKIERWSCFRSMTHGKTALSHWLSICACSLSKFELVSLCLPLELMCCSCVSGCLQTVNPMSELWKTFKISSSTFDQFNFSSPVLSVGSFTFWI